MNQDLFFTEETIGYLLKLENGIKVPEKYFKILCRTPKFSNLSEWRAIISQENINLAIKIQERISNETENDNLENLLKKIQNYKNNDSTNQYLEIIKNLYKKEVLNVLEDLIHPYHHKIHSGLPICDIGEFRKQNVWFVDPNSDNFNIEKLSPPPFESVPKLMQIWQKMYYQKSQNPIIDNLLLYLIFQFIHPLENDNGKFGWILLIISSLKQNFYFENIIMYPQIILNEKNHFYQLLENTINYNELNPLINFLLINLEKVIDEDFDFQIEFKRKLF